MLTLEVDKIGELALIVCEGSIAEAADAARLSAVVLSQARARVIMIDLSESNTSRWTPSKYWQFFNAGRTQTTFSSSSLIHLLSCVTSSRASTTLSTLNSLHYKRRWVCSCARTLRARSRPLQHSGRWRGSYSTGAC